MNDKKWERWGFHGGLIAVAALVAIFATYGVPPDADAPAAEIAEWYADNDATIRFSTVLLGVGVIGLSWWFGSLWRHMRRAEDGEPRLAVIAAIGLILSGATAMISIAVGSAAAMRIDDVGEEGAVLAWAFANTSIGLSAVGDVILIAAVSTLAIRTRFLPTWLAYGGGLAALVNLVAALSAATDSAVISIFGLIGFLSWLAWIAAISLVMIERKTEPPEALDLTTAKETRVEEPIETHG